MNSAYLVSLLYCLIVVPRELWLKDTENPSIANLDSSSVLGLFSITIRPIKFDASPVLALLRHLRNALAHARFSIDKSGNFIFWDQENERSPRNFQAAISTQDLEAFLSSVGATLANLRNE
jgi:hypothetical protein